MLQAEGNPPTRHLRPMQWTCSRWHGWDIRRKRRVNNALLGAPDVESRRALSWSVAQEPHFVCAVATEGTSTLASKCRHCASRFALREVKERGREGCRAGPQCVSEIANTFFLHIHFIDDARSLRARRHCLWVGARCAIGETPFVAERSRAAERTSCHSTRDAAQYTKPTLTTASPARFDFHSAGAV